MRLLHLEKQVRNDNAAIVIASEAPKGKRSNLNKKEIIRPEERLLGTEKRPRNDGGLGFVPFLFKRERAKENLPKPKRSPRTKIANWSAIPSL